jgi:hypothetical protein
MSKFPGMTSWLNVVVQKATGGLYEHALAQENGHYRSLIVPQLQVLIPDAHEHARRRLRKLATGSLNPLNEPKNQVQKTQLRDIPSVCISKH